MSKRRAHVNCSVSTCQNQHPNVFSIPVSADQTTRDKWIQFIFGDDVPACVPTALFVCAKHFAPKCFSNLGQYQAKMASTLRLEKGAVPSEKGLPSASTSQADPSTSNHLVPLKVDVGCQTVPTMQATAGTQLSLKTFQPHFRSRGTQTVNTSTDVEVCTSAAAVVPGLPWSSAPTSPSLHRPGLRLEEDEDEDSSVGACSSPAASEPRESTDKWEDPSPACRDLLSSYKERKLVVFESCLLELFEECPVCRQVCSVKKNLRGTLLAVVQSCPHCRYWRRWRSQPVIGHSTPAGNLQLSAAIYFSGASFFNVQKVFKAMQLQMHTYRQFRVHCCNILEPAVLQKWRTDQATVLRQLSRGGNAVLGGHSVKHGSFTLMDQNSNVVDIQLVQSSEVGGSTDMQKEAVKRSLKLLEDSGIKLECVVSDRRPQLQEFLSDVKITQYYDVRHFEKGIYKKLKAIANTRECEKVKKWLPMIKNQIYWIAASSCSGPERVAKWASVINHLQDIHTHTDPLYPKCAHPPRVSKDKEKWLKAGTPALYKLKKLFTGKRVLKDVAKLCPHQQSSCFEAFHSAVTRFLPKGVTFPFLETLCRLYLSAMHFNENSEQPERQADGKPHLEIHWGACTVKALREDPTFNYVDELMRLVFEVVFPDPAPFVSQLRQIVVPEPLRSQYDGPAMEDVVAR